MISRHTFGTRAVDNGASMVAVQKVMGHKSIETTMQYVHATDEGKRRDVEAVEKASLIQRSAEPSEVEIVREMAESNSPVTIRTQNEKRRSA